MVQYLQFRILEFPLSIWVNRLVRYELYYFNLWRSIVYNILKPAKKQFLFFARYLGFHQGIFFWFHSPGSTRRCKGPQRVHLLLSTPFVPLQNLGCWEQLCFLQHHCTTVLPALYHSRIQLEIKFRWQDYDPSHFLGVRQGVCLDYQQQCDNCSTSNEVARCGWQS